MKSSPLLNGLQQYLHWLDIFLQLIYKREDFQDRATS